MVETIVQLAAQNLLSPIILFFALGLAAALVRSDLSVPEAAAKALSIYLLFAIGFKGGVSVSAHGVDATLLWSLVAGGVLSFAIPFVAFGLLRVMTGLSVLDAAAVAGHYGSISIVTFVAATSVLQSQGIANEGYLVAVAAVMEAPAILSALWLAARFSSNGARGGRQQSADGLWREILFNGSIVLLIGSFTIGFVTGPKGLSEIESFIVSPFKGVLCLFLLDMGLVAGRGLRASARQMTPGLISFGILMPVIGAAAGLGASALVGLSSGGTVLLMTLSASASYIAVPAAMRVALPEANPSIYLTMSLGITFPFNLTLGIPLYLSIAQAIGG
ncbi:sodium-dependent bicarbonate transport family permease [Roseibium sp.]|uniref:sodium-dependent bicarbonate transport family permease n=1 Tax=Roseibium sp. TaxID=1936156 RepID=UPI003D0EC364